MPRAIRRRLPISPPVALQQAPHALHLGPRVLARAVGDQADLRRLEALKFFEKFCGMTMIASSRRVRTASSGSFGPLGDRDAGLLPQPVDQTPARTLTPTTATFDRHRPEPLADGHAVEQEEIQSRRQQRADEHR
jgi:hypothetical protein